RALRHLTHRPRCHEPGEALHLTDVVSDSHGVVPLDLASLVAALKELADQVPVLAVVHLDRPGRTIRERRRALDVLAHFVRRVLSDDVVAPYPELVRPLGVPPAKGRRPAETGEVREHGEVLEDLGAQITEALPSDLLLLLVVLRLRVVLQTRA